MFQILDVLRFFRCTFAEGSMGRQEARPEARLGAGRRAEAGPSRGPSRRREARPEATVWGARRPVQRPPSWAEGGSARASRRPDEPLDGSPGGSLSLEHLLRDLLRGLLGGRSGGVTLQRQNYETVFNVGP